MHDISRVSRWWWSDEVIKCALVRLDGVRGVRGVGEQGCTRATPVRMPRTTPVLVAVAPTRG